MTFQAGDTEKSFNFAATQDTDNDDGEYVLLGLGNLPARVSSAAPSQATVSITDDDVPQVTVSFGSATYSVAESDDPDTTDATENEATVKVTLSADPERTVTIPITKNNQGGATNADYSGVPASMVFNSGDTEKSFTFSATADTVDDDDERVKLTFGTLPTGVSEGTTKEAVVSINDDDVPSVTVSFGSATYSVAESDDDTTTDVAENEVTVKVKLSADPERTVTIPISKTDQDGASSADYSGVPTSVTFNSGDTEKTFTFSATHDTVDDDGENVKLTFGTLPTRVQEGTPRETVVSITDNDSGRQPGKKEISGGGDAGVAISFEQAFLPSPGGKYHRDQGDPVGRPGNGFQHAAHPHRWHRPELQRLLGPPGYRGFRLRRDRDDLHAHRRPGPAGRERRDPDHRVRPTADRPAQRR